MSEYIVQRETLTALADEVRELAGKTEELSLETMRGDVSAANEEVAEQSDLIAQVKSAMDGKAVKSGTDLCTITVTVQCKSSPQTYLSLGEKILRYTAFQDGRLCVVEETVQEEDKNVNIFGYMMCAQFTRTIRCPYGTIVTVRLPRNFRPIHSMEYSENIQVLFAESAEQLECGDSYYYLFNVHFTATQPGEHTISLYY